MNKAKVKDLSLVTWEISLSLLLCLEDQPYLEVLLSVAVGSQLADVFLHLLPEAFAHPQASPIHIGLWTLTGLFIFFLIEQLFPNDDDDDDHQEEKEEQSTEVSSSFSLSLSLSGGMSSVILG